MIFSIQAGPAVLLECDGRRLSIFTFRQRHHDASECGLVEGSLDVERDVLVGSVLHLGDEVSRHDVAPFRAAFDCISIIRQRLACIENSGEDSAQTGQKRVLRRHYRKLLSRMEQRASAESQPPATGAQ